MIFTDVVLLNMNSVQSLHKRTSTAIEASISGPQPLAIVITYRLHQIRECRSSEEYCPYLTRLVLESDFDAWSGGGLLFHHHLETVNLIMLTHRLSPPAPAALSPKQDSFLILVQNLRQTCLRLRAVEYVAPRTRSDGVPLLSDEQACMLAQCLETGASKALPEQFIVGSRPLRSSDGAESPAEHSRNLAGQKANREADEQDRRDLAAIQTSSSDGRVRIDDIPSYFKVEFKASLCRLDHLTAWALC